MGKQQKQWQTTFLGSKITADGDCSHEIKRHLLLRKKKRWEAVMIWQPHPSSLSLSVSCGTGCATCLPSSRVSAGHYSRVPPACSTHISKVPLLGAPFEWGFKAYYLLPSPSWGSWFGSFFHEFRQLPVQWPISFSIVSFSPEIGPCKHKLKAIPTSRDIHILKAPPILCSFFCCQSCSEQ